MNPPIRGTRHRNVLRKTLQKGQIDIIGSDHAPHLKSEINQIYPNSPSGMPGVQSLLPILLNEVTKNTISLNEVVKLTSFNPKKIFKIKNKGLIKVGYDADLTIVDMNKTKKVLNKDMKTKCGWTPFNNHKVKGFPVATIVNGHLVMSDGKVIVESKGTPLKF